MGKREEETHTSMCLGRQADGDTHPKHFGNEI